MENYVGAPKRRNYKLVKWNRIGPNCPAPLSLFLHFFVGKLQFSLRDKKNFNCYIKIVVAKPTLKVSKHI